MIGALAATRLPQGLDAALASYETIAYNGTWLILGLVSLVLPRGDVRPSDDERPPALVGESLDPTAR